MGIEERIVDSSQDWRHSAMTGHAGATGIGPVVPHVPSLGEVERLFTDTPEAAVAEEQIQDGMRDANAALQTQLAAHVEASPPAIIPEAFGSTEGGPDA